MFILLQIWFDEFFEERYSLILAYCEYTGKNQRANFCKIKIWTVHVVRIENEIFLDSLSNHKEVSKEEYYFSGQLGASIFLQNVILMF